MFYTYAHYTPEGRLFYVGKGSGTFKRAYVYTKRNKFWKNIVNKHGAFVVKILAFWDEENKALAHEVFLIKHFRALGEYLANMTDGGEGVTGYRPTEEQKRQRSLSQRGRPGVKPSAETLAKMRMAHIGQVAWNKGLRGCYKRDPETIEKTAAKLRGRIYNAKYRYIGVHKETGKIIECLGNQSMRDRGLDPAKVRGSADGKRSSHKDYVWTKELLEA